MIHLLKIDFIEHKDVNGNVLWSQNNVNNTFHADGQFFVLNAIFNTSEEIVVPSSYYLGLDNRSSIDLSDILDSLSEEPTQNGYVRQSVSSLNGFDINEEDSNYRAVSGVVTFSASGGSWGPVKNLFLCTSAGDEGYLISSAALNTTRTLLDGQSVTMRISVGLEN